ncbi:hypothetical protein BD414DRAFT_10527 [Trametes punicea]|nr:hypothetical protein BD414DRAFT_10527 [Trametes punicea]
MLMLRVAVVVCRTPLRTRSTRKSEAPSDEQSHGSLSSRVRSIDHTCQIWQYFRAGSGDLRAPSPYHDFFITIVHLTRCRSYPTQEEGRKGLVGRGKKRGLGLFCEVGLAWRTSLAGRDASSAETWDISPRTVPPSSVFATIAVNPVMSLQPALLPGRLLRSSATRAAESAIFRPNAPACGCRTLAPSATAAAALGTLLALVRVALGVASPPVPQLLDVP